MFSYFSFALEQVMVIVADKSTSRRESNSIVAFALAEKEN
jgi:hypothetical protein